MEKIFRPNRIFVIFCLLLIFVWLGLQHVSNMRIKEAAKGEALEIFDWNWPGQVSSKAEVLDVAVLSKSEFEAKVRVKAKQTLIKLGSVALTESQKDETQNQGQSTKIQPAAGAASSSDTACVLTLYRSNRNWVLGKVEFD